MLIEHDHGYLSSLLTQKERVFADSIHTLWVHIQQVYQSHLAYLLAIAPECEIKGVCDKMCMGRAMHTGQTDGKCAVVQIWTIGMEVSWFKTDYGFGFV